LAADSFPIEDSAGDGKDVPAALGPVYGTSDWSGLAVVVCAFAMATG
jgi:hypothetical protein